MVTNLKISPETEIFYPSEDDEPLAETPEHLLALINTFTVLTRYLAGQQAMVFSNQFLYYVEGLPSARVAPDIMVIFNIEPKIRNNYKIWEERQVPKIIIEMTSQGNKDNDYLIKKSLYEHLSVEEYWLFDPRGEWVPEQLLGYRLQPEGFYRKITNNHSEVLNLNLVPEGSLLTFYAIDSGEKLLIPDELWQALQEETQARQEAQRQVEEAQRQAEEAEQRAVELEAMLDRYRTQFGDLPSN